MNVQSIVNQINNAINSSTSSSVSNETIKSLENGMNRLMEAGNNAVISGKVIGFEGKNVLLALGENELIKASINSNLSAQIGEMLTLQVKGLNKDSVSLSPLFENTAQESTVNNALKAAGIPDTPQNQYMVKSMMQEGLPIDKQSLYDMSRAMNINATADVLDLAKMTRLNIPLNEDMVGQFQNYMNLEHEVSSALMDISDEFINTVLGDTFDGMDMSTVELVLDNAEALVSYEEVSLEESDALEEQPVNQKVSDEVVRNDTGVINEKESVKVTQSEGEEVTAVLNNNKGDNSIARTLTNLKTVEIPENIIREAENGNANTQSLVKNVLDGIKSKLSNSNEEELKDIKDDIKTVFENPEFKALFKKEVLNKFSLKPEELNEEGSVSKLYERLNNEVKHLLASADTLGNSGSKYSQTVNNLNNNLEFMNELNQAFSYVQIPLKLTGQEANGELYVYKNKKSLSREDGTVSALLHLDMDNLGPVDVHLTLNTENNVKTKFYLKDDAALDLIAEHIDTLNERLNKRGYSMAAEFINKDDDKSVMDTILDDHKNISLLSASGFDARA